MLAHDTDGRAVSSELSNVVSATLTAWDPEPASGGGTNVGMIVGIVVGVVVLMILIAVLVILIVSKNKEKNHDDVATIMKAYDRSTTETMQTAKAERAYDNLSYDVTRA